MAEVALEGEVRGRVGSPQRVAVVQRRPCQRDHGRRLQSATTTTHPRRPPQCHGNVNDAGPASPARFPPTKHAIGGDGVATDGTGDTTDGVAHEPPVRLWGGMPDGAPIASVGGKPTKSLRWPECFSVSKFYAGCSGALDRSNGLSIGQLAARKIRPPPLECT